MTDIAHDVATETGGGAELVWVAPDALGDEALPTVMMKILRHALAKGA